MSKMQMMECVGKISKLPEQLKKKDGSLMNKWDFWIYQHDEKYPNTIAFSLFEKGKNEFGAEMGDTVCVKYILGGREYKGRVYNEAKAFEVDVIKKNPQMSVEDRLKADDDESDDLPY